MNGVQKAKDEPAGISPVVSEREPRSREESPRAPHARRVAALSGGVLPASARVPRFGRSDRLSERQRVVRPPCRSTLWPMSGLPDSTIGGLGASVCTRGANARTEFVRDVDL